MVPPPLKRSDLVGVVPAPEVVQLAPMPGGTGAEWKDGGRPGGLAGSDGGTRMILEDGDRFLELGSPRLDQFGPDGLATVSQVFARGRRVSSVAEVESPEVRSRNAVR